MGHDQRIPCQLLQRKRLPRLSRQGMVLRENGAPGLIAYGNAFQVFAVIGCGNNAQLIVATEDMVADVIAAAVGNFKTHQGIFLPESCQPPSGEKGGKPRHAAQAQCAAETHGKGGHFLPGSLRQIQQLLRPPVEKQPRLGQLKASSAPDEELSAQLLLQIPNLVAQRRLAHIQPLGRPGEIQLLRYNGKIIQAAKIHGVSSFLKNPLCVYRKTDVLSPLHRNS